MASGALCAAVGSEDAEGIDRQVAAPVGLGRGGPGRPVEHPAAVVALRACQVVQVRLDHGLVEERAGDRAGQRREVKR